MWHKHKEPGKGQVCTLRFSKQLALKRPYTQLIKETTPTDFVMKLHQLKIQHQANF